jgi:hypothetical protein
MAQAPLWAAEAAQAAGSAVAAWDAASVAGWVWVLAAVVGLAKEQVLRLVVVRV